MLRKKLKRGLCPLLKMKECRKDCVFYREGFRYYDDPAKEPEHFEECAVNVIADNVEQVHNKIYTLQKEMGDTKNVIGYRVLQEMGLITDTQAKRKVVRTLENGVDYVDGPSLLVGPEDEDNGKDS